MKINTKMFSSVNYRSIILGLVMFASILAFLFTGFGRLQVFNFRGMDPNMALIVGNQSVDMNEFSHFMTAQGYSSSMPENQKKYLAFQVLSQLVEQKLLIEESEKIGFGANQSDVAAFIRSLRVFHDPVTGQFSMDRLKQYLASQQINDVEFFRSVQNELTAQNLSNLIFLPEVYPKSVAKAQYGMEHTAFTLQYAALNINQAYIEKQASAQVDEFLKNNENQTQLQQLYQSKQSQYTQKTQYKVLSILIAYKDAMRSQGEARKRSKQEAQELIDSRLLQIKNGANFSQLATQTNDDIQARQNKGELGYIDDTNIDPDSYQAVSNLSSDKPLSSIVDTPYGFRLFMLEDKKEGFTKTFDDVKASLAQELIAQKLRQSLETEFDNKINELLAKGAVLSAIDTALATQGIIWQSFEKPFTIKDSVVTELGSAKPLAENVFSLHKPGDVIPKILDFGPSKRVLIKLISKRTADNPSDADIEALQKQVVREDSQEFYRALLQSWKESYEQKGEIKMNPVLVP